MCGMQSQRADFLTDESGTKAQDEAQHKDKQTWCAEVSRKLTTDALSCWDVVLRCSYYIRHAEYTTKLHTHTHCMQTVDREQEGEHQSADWEDT